MDGDERSNLLIEGFGSSNGGVFNDIRLSGHASLSGNVDCIKFGCSGITKVKGNVKAQNAKVYGMSTILGNFEATDLKFSGKTDIGGNLSGENIQIEGDLDVKGNCKAENHISKSRFKFGGFLHAKHIEIALYGHCRAKNIYGNDIHIKSGNKNINFLHRLSESFKPKITTDIIEGKDIYLENTYANVVRGINITLGPGCEINHIEYQNSYMVDKDSKVNSYTML